MLDTTPPQHAPARPDAERRGCLFALSQPPLMIFLLVIGCLLMLGRCMTCSCCEPGGRPAAQPAASRRRARYAATCSRLPQVRPEQ
ncbi:hypothetical protein GA0115250_112566 [Streptomyces sp. BvitLS-983]|nr:hypothetical protein GA0115250_112566 [Streptomyces sp. BvitLS-983]